jgi:hypothetical protein
MSTALAARTKGSSSGTPGKNGRGLPGRNGPAKRRAKAAKASPEVFREELAGLPGEINAKHKEYTDGIRTNLHHAREAGDLLKEAKRLCKVLGISWKEWVTANCDFSPRSAQVYMRIAENWDELTKAQCIAQLGIATADRLLAVSRKPRNPRATGKGDHGGSETPHASANSGDVPECDGVGGGNRDTKVGTKESAAQTSEPGGSPGNGSKRLKHRDSGSSAGSGADDSATSTARTAATVLEAYVNASHCDRDTQVKLLAHFLEQDAIDVMVDAINAQDRIREFEEYVKENWGLANNGVGVVAQIAAARK